MEVLTGYSGAITLAKAIEKAAEGAGDDSYLAAMARRAKAVENNVEGGRTDTAEALERLFEEVELIELRWLQRNGEPATRHQKTGGRR